jgi:hypothetical protein
MGRMMGLEPTAFCATNRRSNRLSYIRRVTVRQRFPRVKMNCVRFDTLQPQPTAPFAIPFNCPATAGSLDCNGG